MTTVNPIELRALNDVRGELGLKPLTDSEFAWRYMPRAVRVAKAKAQARDPGGEGGGQFIEEGRSGIRIPDRGAIDRSKKGLHQPEKRPAKVVTSMSALSEAGKKFVNNGGGTEDDPVHKIKWRNGRELSVRQSDVQRHYEEVLEKAVKGEVYHPEADAEALKNAKNWYRDANRTARNILKDYPDSGLTLEKVAGVLAAVSPRKAWDVWATDKKGKRKQSGNIADARKIIDAFLNKEVDGVPLRDMPLDEAKKHTKGGMHSHVKAALQILHGEDESVLTGTKRRSFWNNITDPENQYDATMDGWMASAIWRMGGTYSDGTPVDEGALSWVDHKKVLQKRIIVPGAGYVILADALRGAASKYGLSPSEAQALYWVAVGGGSNKVPMWSEKRRAPKPKKPKK